MATTTSPAGSAVAPQTDTQVEIQNLINARQKLKHMADALDDLRSQAEAAFLRTVAGDVTALTVDFDRPFVDRTFDKYSAVKTEDDKLALRSASLADILTRMNKRMKEFRNSHREDLIMILRQTLEKLETTRGSQEKEATQVDTQIKQLEAEISQLESGGPAKTQRTKGAAAV
jgi:NADH:ubiquinone oxidoreductase subunit D